MPADPPPAYSPAPALGHAVSTNNTTTTNTSAIVNGDNDPFAFLSTFDTVFLIDDSGSMAGSRWAAVAAALRAITPICTARDPDGIDVYFLNHRSTQRAPDSSKAAGGYFDVSSPAVVDDIFRRVHPGGRTPTGCRLQNILKAYIDVLQRNMDATRPMNIIVITDGSPTDDPEGVIVQNARRLDGMNAPGFQVGVQFFQIGNDPEAKEALMDLDDGLTQQGIRDMVDAVTWDETARGNGLDLSPQAILKVVLGAVVRRLDRRPATRR